MFMLNLFGVNSLLILLTTLIAIYCYLTRHFNYWKDRNVSGVKPYPLIGTSWEFFFRPASQLMLDIYKKYGKISGGFIGARPILIVSDPELVKEMNIRDFHKFVDRNDFAFGDILNDRSLFNLKGEEWKKMRSVISPTFSSGKMRRMHPMIVDCVNRLDNVLEKKAKDKSEINIKNMMGNLTMDVIASCAFATKIDVYDEQKPSEFINNAKKVFRGNWRFIVFFTLSAFWSSFAKVTGFQLQDPSVSNFFTSAITSILSNRRSSNRKYNDYLQLMIDAKNKTTVHDEHYEEEDRSEELFGSTDGPELQKSKQKVEVTDDDILANTFLFFVAGYETTASLLSHLIYRLALDQECQDKLYEEVKAFDGKYNYETIAKMPYLEACVAETLRIYNPVPAIGRMAAEDYTLGDTGLTIPKGMIVNFNVQALHHSPEFYPSPEQFDPDRFMPENKDKLVPYTYMPFGIGPRNCVGMRFALMEAKTAVAHMINKFRFTRTNNTQVPLKPVVGDFILNTGDIIVGIEHRNQ